MKPTMNNKEQAEILTEASKKKSWEDEYSISFYEVDT